MIDNKILEKIKSALLDSNISDDEYMEYAEAIDECKELVKNYTNEFKPGEVIIYQNGDSYELGIVKRVCEDGDCFVYYHTGDTAARTPKENMHKIINTYAFKIRRKNYDEI